MRIGKGFGISKTFGCCGAVRKFLTADRAPGTSVQLCVCGVRWGAGVLGCCTAVTWVLWTCGQRPTNRRGSYKNILFSALGFVVGWGQVGEYISNRYICIYGRELRKYWKTSLSKYALRKNSRLHSILFLLVSRMSAFAPKRGTSWRGIRQ